MKEWDGPAQPELRAKLRALINASDALDQPSADDRQRVRARLAAAVAASAPAAQPSHGQLAADGGSAVPLAHTAHVALGTLLKHSLLAMTLGASVTGAALWVSHPTTRHAAPRAPAMSSAASAPRPAPEASPSVQPPLAAETPAPANLPPSAARPDAPAPPPSAAMPERKPRVVRPHPEPPRPAATLPIADTAARSAPLPPPSAANAPAPSPAPGGASLSEELSLMMAAQRALAANQLSRALTLLDQHAKRFPAGALIPERIAARAVALCRSQRQDEGARELQKLMERAPNSPLISWARADCRGDLH